MAETFAGNVKSAPPTSSPFLSAAMESIRTTASNSSSLLHPSPKDLFLALPRLAHRMGSFWFIDIPDHVENMLGGALRGSIIAEATTGGFNAGAATAEARNGAAQAAGNAAQAAVGGVDTVGGLAKSLGFQNVRGFGGMFSYITSKWALWCILMAIVLNRTQIYASSRRRLALRWHIRLLLRILPILLFSYQIMTVVQAMRCQTSPNYALYKYDNSSKNLEMDFATNGGTLYTLSSTLLPWQGDEQSCLAARMVPLHAESTKAVRLASWRGSLSLLWPMFQTFCLSQFLETLSCALEGRQIQAETGMTLFEHSLAFAEAEAMISAQLGLGPFGGSQETLQSNNTYQTSAISAAIAIKRQNIMDHVNTPPEVLLIGLISGLSHLTSNVLSVFGLQARFRLVSTGFFGLCFMTAFLWSFYAFAPGAGGDVGILRFPTVCIIGFIPHLLILVGIAICASIYLLALTISALSPPHDLPPPRGIKERFKMAHENLQANMQMSNIRINMHEDFYTTLLKLGFMALTAASEAVYLNEGRAIAVRKWTWLEEQRLKEYESSQDLGLGVPSELKDDNGNLVADGVALADDATPIDMGQSSSTSQTQKGGYARERKMQKLQGGKQARIRVPGEGVVAVERSGRWLLAYEFVRGIFWLVCAWMAIGAVKMLEKAGINWKPRWLRRLLRQKKVPNDSQGASSPAPAESTLEFWLLSDDGILSLPENEDVDVEVEMRKRLQSTADTWGAEDEVKLESQMYGWFLNNGWWGNADASGEFRPNTEDDDTTSMISMSTNATDSEWESDHESSGRRTPTQSNPYSLGESSPITDTPLDPSRLAQLLDPRDSADRLEARLLAQHLSSDQILTRARHRQSQNLSRSKVITTNRSMRTRPLTSRITLEEEEEILEQLILSRRSPDETRSTTGFTSGPVSSSNPTSWANGAAGLGATGPQCVVCQSSPRTILVWPCRCLSLCEDCRVSLAMNNFGNCVCCRRDVLGFSRIWVP